MSKFQVDKETANECFDQFCEDWEIDNETADMTDEEKTDFEALKTKIIYAIKKGRLVFEDGSFKYTVSEKSNEKFSGQEVVIKRPLGDAYMEMDKYKDRQGVHKTYAVLAAMSKKNSSFFASLDGIDLKPLIAIVTLFLAG